MEELFSDLLRSYCDALISVQFRGMEDKSIDGGFYCRSCKILHGRAHDAIYPFVVMAKRSGDRRYLDAAEAVFDFGENFRCDDGSFYNDAQSTWPSTTVFHTISLCEALTTGREILSSATREKWEKRLSEMSEWLFRNLDENYNAVINYPATNTAALALTGQYFGKPEYLKQAKHLADYAMGRITENGFLYGEAHPRDAVSPLGCRMIDIGYNAEESFPALVKYAFAVGDEEMKDRLSEILLKQLDFMLPDGAWDNSFGIRNNKWTYWGSRTSDGCAPAYLLLASRHPAFAEAARRNTELLAACTHDGFLYGGPHYKLHGEYPCTHHTFEHANAIAYALEHSENLPEERTALPIDFPKPLAFYPEINTFKLAMGDYRATVTGYDANLGAGRHVGGGTLSMLWKYGAGPMIAASVTDYTLVEAHNQQLPLKKATHRPLVPRLTAGTYTTSYFATPVMESQETDSGILVDVHTGLTDKNGIRMKADTERRLLYTLTKDGLILEAEGAQGTKLILPVITGEVRVETGKLTGQEEIFFLTGGFTATEYTVLPAENGVIRVHIR